ncbi:glycosyltransferase family 2 protein [Verrucomicrobiota bacterium]
MSDTISIVLPAYNEEANVLPFFEAISKVFAEQLSDHEMEVVFVNDGSRDGTLKALKDIAAGDSRVRVVSLTRNFGAQAAFTAGLRHATGRAVVTMDCDFQDPPAIIPQMVARWKEGAKVVYARRASRQDKPFKKVTAAAYYKFLSCVSDVAIPRQVGDFRLVDETVLKELLKLGEHARYLRGMVAWLGHKPEFVDFDRSDRASGETHYTLQKMTKLAMDGLLNFSSVPLKLAMILGFAAILLSMGFMTYMLYDHFVRGVVYRLFKWLTVALFGSMGVQFILIWILGEYIGRIYGDVRRRPLYIVDETVNVPEQQDGGSP